MRGNEAGLPIPQTGGKKGERENKREKRETAVGKKRREVEMEPERQT